ncbi:glycoside hydrolase family 127 protein [Clostridium sp. C8-1-8]|uniref:glycoside hydrolase family 127 protein n=1 Tax=Clostridium sp. C8-1-8 TaxID=2698831 RepID=UPI0013689807|nr:glycoside hydrolase family 127 protein [Clostridium sp. C8-1-8]
MEKVQLLDGIFKESQEKGKEYLLYLDTDRLLAPCYEAIGETPKKPRYGGWESKPISGHSLGHFLSALATMYLEDKDERLNDKLKYAVSELAYLQSLDEEGYVSGFPKDCFIKVFSGDFNVNRFELGDSWVPWYSIHKIFAGLIDAYVFTGNEQALEVVKKLSDWAKKGTDNLTEEQFDKMLYCEHGGMCEAMAKLYEITKNEDYLQLSKRFYHKETLVPLTELQDELEGKHANTQIPKVIGASKLYELTGEEKYKNAAKYFWNVVTKSRSYAIGGNSIDEHFGKPSTERLGVTTAETCNTYNMLKLTEHLYAWEHDAYYIDYYENALYNHILASQDPESGMKTYFVSTQPGHFKVYCSPDDSFWCCTGTGMENPGRYTRNIYYREEDKLFVNLYIASKIELEDKGIVLKQETKFPKEDKTTLIFEEAEEKLMTISIRVPYWVNGEIKVVVNGKEEHTASKNGYISIQGNWKKGDVIDVSLPMSVHVYTSKDNSNKIAFMYGPLVLAGALGRENFPETDILDDHLKLNHYPGIAVSTLVTDKFEECIKPVEGANLTFETEAIAEPGHKKYTLIPFYELHHQRYTIYWTRMTPEEYKDAQLNKMDYEESLNKITIDQVNPNEQQPEIEHKLKHENSSSDYSSEAGKGWRQAMDGGYFSYEMNVSSDSEVYLAVTYWGEDKECFINGPRYVREFGIYVDGTFIAEELLNASNPQTLFNKFYPIPKSLTEGKSKVEIKFLSSKEKIAGRVFGVRITTSNEV